MASTDTHGDYTANTNIKFNGLDYQILVRGSRRVVESANRTIQNADLTVHASRGTNPLYSLALTTNLISGDDPDTNIDYRVTVHDAPFSKTSGLRTHSYVRKNAQNDPDALEDGWSLVEDNDEATFPSDLREVLDTLDDTLDGKVVSAGVENLHIV